MSLGIKLTSSTEQEPEESLVNDPSPVQESPKRDPETITTPNPNKVAESDPKNITIPKGKLIVVAILPAFLIGAMAVGGLMVIDKKSKTSEANLARAIAHIKGQEEQIATLKKEVESSKGSQVSLAGEKAEKEALITDLSNKMQALKDSTSKELEKAQRLEQQLREIAVKVSVGENAKGLYESQIADLKARATEDRKRIQDLQVYREEMGREYERLKEQKKTADGDLAEAKNTIKKMETSLGDMTKERDEAVKRVERLNKQIADLKKMLIK